MKLGYTIVYVPDVAASLAFFEQAFGLTRRFLHESGTYGELDTGATTLSFAAHDLAAANLPLAVVPLVFAYRGLRAAGSLARVAEVPAARAAFNKHRAWVRWTVPVWLYVAVTGWIIYVILGRWGAVTPH